jgi:hypothetical protein
MTLPVTDNFPAGSGYATLSAYSASWVETSGAEVIEPGLIGVYPSGAPFGLERWVADAFSPDQYATLTLTTYGGSVYVALGPAVRIDTGGAITCYFVQLGGSSSWGAGQANKCGLYKVLAGTVTLLDEVAMPSVGTAVTLKAVGNLITVEWNSTAQTSKTDNAIVTLAHRITSPTAPRPASRRAC